MKKVSKNDKVELSLKGVFSPKDFRKSITAFVGLINEVSESISSEPDSEWAISVDKGSMIIRAKANPEKKDSLKTVLKATPIIHSGLEQLESNLGEDFYRHPALPTKALKHVKILADLAAKSDRKKVSINSNGSYIPLSYRTVSNADKILRSNKIYTSIGNIEGELSALDSRSKFKMVICRSLDGLRVDCFTNDSDLESKAIKAFRKRVSIYGLVQYNNKGKPLRVTAERIRVFRPDSELMPLSEIEGALT